MFARQRLRTPVRRLLAALVPLTIAACGGGGGDGGGGGVVNPPGPRVPASITFDAGSTASGTVGSALPGTITVTVRTASNLPVPGTTVTFSASAGTVSATSAQTDDNGRATAGTWTLGNTAGSQTLTASAGAASGQLVATALAGAPTTLEIVSGIPASIRAGVPITPTPTVRAKDQFNNIVNRAGITITASLQSGIGTLNGTQATTDANGIAAFTTLSVGGLVSDGPRTLAFSTTGAPTVVATPTTLEAGTTASITLQNVPAIARAGVPIAPVIVARLADQFGNLMTRPTPVTASLALGAGTITGGTAQTSPQGDAVFTSLAIEGLVGNRQLRFTADQAAVVTGTIALAPGDAAQLRITAQPTVVENTLLFPTPVDVRVSDRFGNAVPDGGRGITASVASGGGILQGAVKQTDATGLASFSSLRLVGSVGSRTIAFSAPGLTGVTSAPIQLDPGPPRLVAFVQAPSTTIVVGFPLQQQPALQLADSSGNLVRRVGVPVRATPLDAPGELLNDVAITDNQGIARFEQLTFLPANAFPPTSMRLRFSSGAEAAIVTGPLTLQTPGASGVQSVTYGSAAQRLFLLDAGATLNLTAVARDGVGNALSQIPMVYSSANANAATVRTNGSIVGVAGGSTWVRAFGAGTPNVRDSVYVTVPRDATAPIVGSTQVTPIVIRAGVTTNFDIVLDTRATTIGATTILVGIPNEVISSIAWQGLLGSNGNVVIGVDPGLNTLRISVTAPAGLTGIVPIARLALTSNAGIGFLFNREITITPLEMFDSALQNLAPRSTGVNIPMVP